MTTPKSSMHRRWVQLSTIAAVLAVIGGGLYAVFHDTRPQMIALSSAQSTGAQWANAQSDIEILALIIAIQDAQLAEVADKTAHLEEVRLRYDILYGRLQILIESPLYQKIHSHTDTSYILTAARDFLAWSAPLIDSGLPTLEGHLPALGEQLKELRKLVRDFTIISNRVMANESDARRDDARTTIANSNALSSGLIVLLLILVVFLTVIMRKSQSRARDHAQTTERVEAILNNSFDAIVGLDSRDRIETFSPAAEGLFGYTAQEAIGKPIWHLVQPILKEASTLPLPGPGLRRVRGHRANRETFDAEVSIGQIMIKNRPARVLFLRDITSRLAAEEALVVARDQALAGEKAKADMLAVMSHEMRTPLNGILGTLDLMTGDTVPQALKEHIDIIRNSGEVLLGHINDVLDISRLDAGMMPLEESDFDLIKLLSDVIQTLHPAALRQKDHLSLQMQGEGLAFVRGDMRKLRQILFNLTDNAIKFTRGGKVMLQVERLEGPWVRLTVSDTGIGIAPSQIERIFDEFVTINTSYSRPTQGSGLGLPILRRLVKRMGGDTVVQSQEGHGSTFIVTLPLPAVYGSTQNWHHPPPPRPQARLNILLVEDNPINRFVARSMMLHDGHQVTEAEDGAKALSLALSQSYDLILMDIGLPDMDGLQTTRALRKSAGPNQTTPIIAVTAHALPTDVERFKEAGLDRMLLKPLTQAALRAVILETPPPLPLAAGAVLIDSDRPDSLRATLGEAGYLTLRARFIAETDIELHRLVELNIAPEQAELAHRLGGSAALFGAEALHKQLIHIEEAARAGQSVTFSGLLALWEATQMALLGSDTDTIAAQ